ncbi:MAG: AzlD domain-containing protein [Dehalococcoidaceae bacterium]|nr:AzlD domain-containing protein [Dehalococcoidaceae bacterium]
MNELDYIWLILGMGLVTYIPRWLPLAVLAGRRLPGWLVEWLDLIPVAILASLLLPLMVVSDTTGKADPLRPEFLAGIITLVFALKVKSLSGTVIVGMLVYWLISSLI